MDPEEIVVTMLQVTMLQEESSWRATIRVGGL
jgi:hypothetical protein